MKDLRVYFKGEAPEGFEKALEELVERMTGLKWWASGRDMRTGVRDICFDKGGKK